MCSRSPRHYATKQKSPAGEFFGVERLDQIQYNLPGPITADATVEGIAKAVARFEGDETPADDQTLLAVGGSGMNEQ